MPRFSPEHFVRVRLTDPLKRKQLKKGLDQLSEEGAVQLLFDRHRLERTATAWSVIRCSVRSACCSSRSPSTSVEFDPLSFQHACWVEGAPEDLQLEKFERAGRSTCVLDVESRPLVLFESERGMRMTIEDHPKLKFVAAVQPGRSGRAAA